MLTSFQARVAQIILAAAQPFGFALGGGQALGVHGIVKRMSADIDGYSDTLDPAQYVRAEAAVLAAASAAGLVATTIQSNSWLRVFEITDPQTEDTVVVDLGYDSRSRPANSIPGLGKVLDIEDVVFGKVRAFVDRSYARDFVDIDAILRDGRWTVGALYESIRPIRALEVPEPQDFGRLLREARDVDPEEYAALGLDTAAQVAMFERLDEEADAIDGLTETR